VLSGGLYVNGVNEGTRYEATFAGYTGARQGDCDRWTDWTKWTAQDKEDIKGFALASMDALTVCCSTPYENVTYPAVHSISSSGLGRLVIPLVKVVLTLHSGRTSLDLNKVGCHQTLVIPSATALVLVLLPLPLLLYRLLQPVEEMLEPSLLLGAPPLETSLQPL
jgi:hypothetical protein